MWIKVKSQDGLNINLPVPLSVIGARLLVKIAAKYGYRNNTFSKYCSYYVNMLPAESLYGEYAAAMHNRPERIRDSAQAQ